MVASAIRGWLKPGDKWEGSCTELLEILEGNENNPGIVSEKETRRKEWPKSPSALSGKLRRAQSFLRRVGIDVDLDGRSAKKRIVKLHNRNSTEDGVIPVTGVMPNKNDNLAMTTSQGDDEDRVIANPCVTKKTLEYQHNDLNDTNDAVSPNSSIDNPNKPTAKRCGHCPEYLVEPGWLGCKVADEKLKNLDSCPLGKTWD